MLSESPAVSQRVVAGDGEVEAGLFDSRGVTVERHRWGRTQQFGIEEFENVWKQNKTKQETSQQDHFRGSSDIIDCVKHRLQYLAKSQHFNKSTVKVSRKDPDCHCTDGAEPSRDKEVLVLAPGLGNNLSPGDTVRSRLLSGPLQSCSRLRR